MAFVDIESVVFGAPDVELARSMFADWGLNTLRHDAAGVVVETGIGSRVVVRTQDAPQLPPRLSGGSNFRELIWGVSSRKHLDAIARELGRDRTVGADRDGTIHSVDDCGINIGFRVWAHRQEKRRRGTPFNSPGQRARIDAVATVYRRARPYRMGHVAFFVPDVKAGEGFYVKRLGFWLSDRYAGGAAAFLRHAARSDHHNLFLLKSRTGATEVHHVAFEVRDVHEVFGGGLHFSQCGWATAVGPGRHPISSAYFWYFRNPLGGMIEYFCDPDFVTSKWKPSNYRVNRFSEWHLADGIKRVDDGHARPSLAMAKAIKPNSVKPPVAHS
jgi:catechol 2,3-dioxygenase-like lactoylglutathione lyase family enzyme